MFWLDAIVLFRVNFTTWSCQEKVKLSRNISSLYFSIISLVWLDFFYPAISFQVELVLEFEELLPPVLRSKLRSGYKVVYPWNQKKIEWLREEHESCELIELILERKAHKLGGKHGKLHHDKYYHHTERPVKHTAAYVSIATWWNLHGLVKVIAGTPSKSLDCYWLWATYRFRENIKQYWWHHQDTQTMSCCRAR